MSNPEFKENTTKEKTTQATSYHYKKIRLGPEDKRPHAKPRQTHQPVEELGILRFAAVCCCEDLLQLLGSHLVVALSHDRVQRCTNDKKAARFQSDSKPQRAQVHVQQCLYFCVDLFVFRHFWPQEQMFIPRLM